MILPEGAESILTGNAASPFLAESAQYSDPSASQDVSAPGGRQAQGMCCGIGATPRRFRVPVEPGNERRDAEEETKQTI